jgi:hypothetical protein
MKNKQILGALSMDLKRAALGYYRGSFSMADVFYEEAVKRSEEIDLKTLKPYLKEYLKNVKKIKNKKREIAAEDALLYSTLFQNASQAL